MSWQTSCMIPPAGQTQQKTMRYEIMTTMIQYEGERSRAMSALISWAFIGVLGQISLSNSVNLLALYTASLVVEHYFTSHPAHAPADNSQQFCAP